jgi:enoyl-CoA hydratase/carnithine racemase
MTQQRVLYAKNNHIAWITLNSQETGNRIDLAMAQELAEVCAQINSDQDVFAVFLTGTGPAFCAGGKFSPADKDAATGSPAESLAALNQPVIAVVNGDALETGLELALACDLRLAVDTAHFGLPQIQEGRIPINGGTQRLTRVVGKGKALELVLTGEIVDAQTAFEIGLVNRVVKTDELKSEAEKLAVTLAAKAPFALRYIKEAVNKGLDLTLEQGLRLEADLYFLLHTTADRTEGIRAFLQKRTPKYEGK